MRTSKFTVEQIASTLRRAEADVAVVEVCRELGITETTFYRWKRKYHGVGTPELNEPSLTHPENRHLLPLFE
jgi:putative transposase